MLASVLHFRSIILSPPPLLPQLVIRVHMSDESSKTMMVDERQTVRQVLDSLLDKSHCGYSPDWSLVETITELQMGKGGVRLKLLHCCRHMGWIYLFIYLLHMAFRTKQEEKKRKHKLPAGRKLRSRAQSHVSKTARPASCVRYSTSLAFSLSFLRAHFRGSRELGGESAELDAGQPQQAHVHRAHREIRSLQEPSGESPRRC